MKGMMLNIIVVVLMILISSCGGDSHPGYEFMPNMYRSPSIETYSEHNIENYNGLPVEGTISRGHLSTFNYEGSLEGYLKAGDEANFPKSLVQDENTLNEGKELYQMMCAHCHGDNGDGKGSITHPLYLGVPSYTDDKTERRSGTTMKELKEGHIFHAITYGIEGKAMGPHASQITELERWKIVYYVQEVLQNNKEE